MSTSDLLYAGIGSRETPPDILLKMVKIGCHLAKMGWTLRSGGAPGADSAFEKGCDLGGGDKQIFLPWKGFQGNSSLLYNITEQAFDLTAPAP